MPVVLSNTRMVLPPLSAVVLQDVLSDPVTVALNATGGGTRYDVFSDADLDAVPWGTLGAGDVVNVNWKSAAYTRKLGMRAIGTPTNLVRIWGVTDASGNRPKFNFSGSKTCPKCNPSGGYVGANDIFTSTPAFGESLGGIVLKRGASDGYGTYEPAYMRISNLELYGAQGVNTYTALDGSTQSFTSAFTSSVRMQLANDSWLENCLLHDNDLGLFTQAKDGLYSEACKRITVRCNRVYNNGVNASNGAHGVYIQCANPVVEGNFFGQCMVGSQGASYKSRCSGEIFRYNWCEPSAVMCDWVESTDQDTDGIYTKADYGLDYVYGNVFCNDGRLPNFTAPPYALSCLWYGGDQGTDVANRKKLHCFWNTYFTYTGSDTNARVGIFAVAIYSGTVPPTYGDVYPLNNVIAVMNDPGVTPGDTCSWLTDYGNLTFYGSNIAFTPRRTMLTCRPGSEAQCTLTNSGNALITTDPLFTNTAAYTTNDFTPQAGSPALGAAVQSPGAIWPSILAANPIQFSPRRRNNGLVVRASTANLGAY